jgi:tetratricopeptide (TPR) repeat protein
VLRAITSFISGQGHVGVGEYRRAVAFLRAVGFAAFDDDTGVLAGWGTRHIVQARAWLARVLAEVGDIREALAVGEETLPMADATRHRSVLVVTCWGLGLCQIRRGDLSPAIAVLEQALDACRAAEQPGYLPWGGAPLGYAYALAGRLADAIPLLEEASETGAAKGIWADQSLRVAWLGEAYLLDRRHDDAVATTVRALELAQRYEERGNEAWILRLFGEIATQQAPPDAAQAEIHYREALARAKELGMRPLQAHCHLGLGKLHRRIDRLDEARAELSTAVEMLREMEMTFWLPEAEAELARATASPSAEQVG